MTSDIVDHYRQLHAGYTQEDLVDPATTKDIADSYTLTAIRVALHNLTVNQAVSLLSKKLEQAGIQVRLLGKDAAKSMKLIIANHQGPSDDPESDRDFPEVRSRFERFTQDGEVPLGYGGMETMLARAIVPLRTRPVLKSELTDRFPSDCDGLVAKAKAFIKAQLIRRTNPIIFERPSKDLPKKEAIQAASKEKTDVYRKVCSVANRGTPVMFYSEGTRSVTGALKGFQKEPFQVMVTDYLRQRIQNREPLDIGLAVANMGEAMPLGGFRSNALLFKKPITIDVSSWEPSQDLQDRIVSEIDPHAPDERAVSQIGRSLLREAHDEMGRRLRGLLSDIAS